MITQTHNLTAAALGNQTQMLWSPFATPQVIEALLPSLALSSSRCQPSQSHALPENLASRLGYQTSNGQGYVYQNNEDRRNENQDSLAPPIAPASLHWWNCP